MEIIKYVGEAEGKQHLAEALDLEGLEIRREEYAATSGLGHNDPLIVELYVRKLPTSRLSDADVPTAIRRIVADVASRFPDADINTNRLSSESG